MISCYLFILNSRWWDDFFSKIARARWIRMESCISWAMMAPWQQVLMQQLWTNEASTGPAVDKNCRGWNLFSEADIAGVFFFFFEDWLDRWLLTTNKFRRKLLHQKVNLEKVEQKYIFSQRFFFEPTHITLISIIISRIISLDITWYHESYLSISKILVFNMCRYGLFPWK